jgi:uncharacterized protein (DUF58 family)
MLCVLVLGLALVGPLLLEYLSAGLHLPNAARVTLIPLALLLWFTWEWILFAVRVRVIVKSLRADRFISDARGRVETLWGGTTFTVRLRVSTDSTVGFPYLTLTERLPFGAQRVAGALEFEGALTPARPAEWDYQVLVHGVGQARFEGLTLQMADLQGLFYFTTFVPCLRVYRVLPPLFEPAEPGGTVKRRNLMLPPGIHHYRRPGAGTELLDLRDYRPGDPPKTIAWKVSARRDRLVTKEFESEVPVRCTLFIDTSSSVRVGPPRHNALVGLVEIAAVVARAASENRDLTGVCRFDEQSYGVTRPARGRRHLVRLLNMLATIAGLPPAIARASAKELLPTAYAFAHQVYPELLRPDINRVPAWLAWLLPPPTYALYRPRPTDYAYRWLPVAILVYALAAVGLMGGVTIAVLSLFSDFDGPAAVALALMLAVVIGAGLVLLRIPGAFFFPQRRRELRWRKQLSALLSVKYDLGPGGLELLLEDEERFGYYVQRLLADHQVPYPAPMYDQQGRYLFAAPAKVEILASALLRAVAKSHDNELFVLLADLLELDDQLEPLLRAVKVALARHHRLMVICPWPPGVAPPESEDDRSPAIDTDMREALRTTTASRCRRAYGRLRRKFARLGVAVVCARSEEPARLILSRLEMLREMRTRR